MTAMTGRSNRGGSARHSAASGAFVGALIGLFTGVRPFIASLALAGYGLIIGAVLGALFGLIGYAVRGVPRGVLAVRVMLPGSYGISRRRGGGRAAARSLAQRAGANRHTMDAHR